MLKEDSLISIIIPVYNREKYIKQCLDSVFVQSFKNWECLVVDDGSLDKTREIITEISRDDSRFKLFKRGKEPKGAPSCRNIGLNNAQGKYVIFLDSDDALAENCLLDRYNTFENEKFKNLDFLVFQGMIFNFTPGDSDILISSFRDNNKDVVLPFLYRDIPWITLNPIYRKESLIENSIKWDEKIKGYQDIQFHLLCITKELKFKIINNQPDCFWRVGNSDKMGLNIIDSSKIESHLYFFNVIIEYLKEYHRFGDAEKKAVFYFLKENYIRSINSEDIKLVKMCVSEMKEKKIVSTLESYFLVKFFFINSGETPQKLKSMLHLIKTYFFKLFFTLDHEHKYFMKHTINSSNMSCKLNNKFND